MNILSKIYCRTFQGAFRAALPVLPYREPEIIKSCAELKCVFTKEGVKSVLIVTDQGVLNNGLTEPVKKVLSENHIPFAVYADTLPNPTVKNVEDALAVYIKEGCNCLIAIGGGSAMDCAKAVGACCLSQKNGQSAWGQIEGMAEAPYPDRHSHHCRHRKRNHPCGNEAHF